MVCSHGRITSAGVLMDHIVTVDFPIEYLAAIQNVAGGIDTPLMRRWFATRSPVYFDAAAPTAETDRVWLAKFIMHDLRNAVADGIYDEGHCIGTYFSFHRLPSINAPFLTSVLRDLTPVLHRTLMRAVADTEDLAQRVAGDVAAERKGAAGGGMDRQGKEQRRDCAAGLHFGEHRKAAPETHHGQDRLCESGGRGGAGHLVCRIPAGAGDEGAVGGHWRKAGARPTGSYPSSPLVEVI